MYKLITHSSTYPKPSCVMNTINQVLIPFDEANTDYQQYLAWLAEGNEPLPADEVNE